MASGGAVFECKGCNRQGDMIDLLAAAWGLDDAGVLYRLRSEGHLKLSAFEVSEALESRHRYKQSLCKGERVKQACLSPGLLDLERSQELLQRLKLRVEYQFSSTREYCPQIFGVATPMEIQAALNNVRKARHRQGTTRKSDRQGIVIPFYDLPGRVVSVTMLDKPVGSAEVEESHIQLSYAGYSEDGLAMHPSLPWADSRAVIVTLDSMLALRMWARCGVQEYQKFPLVLAKPNTNSWQLLGRRKRIVIIQHPRDYAALKLAIRNDCQALLGRSNAPLSDQLSSIRMSRLHQLAISQHKHWSEVVARLLGKATPEEVSIILGQLDLTAEERALVIEHDKERLQSVFEAFKKSTTPEQSIEHRYGLIVQTPDGLHMQNTRGKTRISNATPVIKRIMHYGDKAIAEVDVIRQGEPISFVADYKKLQAEFFAQIHAECLRRGFVFVSPQHWHRQLHSIAIQMHPPEVSQGVGRVGYSAKRQAWYTPTHKISKGRVKVREGVPSWVDVPGRLSPKTKNQRKFIRECTIPTLATVILAARQLIQDALGQPRQPVMFSGVGAMANVSAISNALSVSSKESDTHKWLIIPQTYNTQGRFARAREIDWAFLHGGWLCTTDLQRCFTAFEGAVSFVNHESPEFLHSDKYGYLSALLIHFLKYWSGEEDVVDYCLQRLETFGRTISKRELNKYVTVEIDPCHAFLVMLKELHMNYKPIYGDPVKDSTSNRVMKIVDNERVFIPMNLIELEMRKHKLGSFENMRIVQQLSKSRSYIGTNFHDHHSGWLIAKSAVDAVFSDKRARAETLGLSIVG